MRYYCQLCRDYWADHQPAYTMWTPVRDCPNHLALQGYRWIDAGAATKERIR